MLNKSISGNAVWIRRQGITGACLFSSTVQWDLQQYFVTTNDLILWTTGLQNPNCTTTSEIALHWAKHVAGQTSAMLCFHSIYLFNNFFYRRIAGLGCSRMTTFIGWHLVYECFWQGNIVTNHFSVVSFRVLATSCQLTLVSHVQGSISQHKLQFT